MKSISLTQEKVALVDDEDFEELSKHVWYTRKGRGTFYAMRNIYIEKKNKTILMHRIILNAPEKKEVDHRDLNGLNNQRSNLRIASRAENSTNRRARGSSKYLGVSWNKATKKWRVEIQRKSYRKNLGYFSSEEEAGRAYDFAAKELHGEFARLNFVYP